MKNEQQPNRNATPPEVVMVDQKPIRLPNIWDAPLYEILAIFIVGWWIGTMFH